MTAHTRRRFLGGTFLSASAFGLVGCAARQGPRTLAAPNAAPGPHLARVRVSADRVIRTIAGLRPFRPGGFVVRVQKLDSKTVIHNYGHGGAGITLSWGTAQLAADEARNLGPRDGGRFGSGTTGTGVIGGSTTGSSVIGGGATGGGTTGGSTTGCAVIGCGVVGLAMARVLQERGYTPTIYAREMPPATTSNVAGGLWEPTSVFDLPRVTAAFRRQFGEASRIAFRRYQSMAGERYGVRWLPLYSLTRERAYAGPPGESPTGDIESLYPEARVLAAGEHPFEGVHAHRRYTMLIEPAIYLNALIRDFQVAGGRIVIREFASAAELMGLKEELIFNCTGLGARALFGDEELIPIRGQLVFLLPQPEVDYCTIGPDGIYMFPRRDGVLLGGTFDRGVWSTEPDPAITERILRDNGALFGAMRS